MLKNKLTSLILAVSMTTTAVVSVSAYAVPQHESWGDDFIPEEFSDCIKLEDYDMFISKTGTSYESKYNVALYMYQSAPDQIKLYNVYWIPDELSVTIPDDDTLLEEITAKAENIGGNLKHRGKSHDLTDNTFHISFSSVDSDGDYISMSKEEVSAFFELIKDDVKEYKFSYNRYMYGTGYIDYLTKYKLENIERAGTEIQDVQNFIDSENIDAELIIDGDEISVVPNSDISIEEHFQLAKNLYNQFRVSPTGRWLVGVGDSLEMGGTVDMKNAVKGDANSDSEISIADAAAILQALGNSDKYALSIQGEYNADVDGKAGITVSDAITIQQYAAKLIDSF